ncbi:MAG: hypothetical protein NUV69_04570 [Candidatus Curtissbacteria bacterium]|nr:hypothetical protein [Candidatus Curtissbacteria bacterium]
MSKKQKLAEEEIKNFTEFIDLLQEETERQKHMSEKEKKDNAVKMGDIYY